MAPFEEEAVGGHPVRARVEEMQEILGIGRGRLSVPEVCEVGSHPGPAELGGGLVDVVAGDALAVPPSPRLVRAEARPAHLLGVAGVAAQVPVDQLAPGGRSRHPLRVGRRVGLVVEGGEGAQLRVRAEDDPGPGEGERREEPDEEDGVTLHAAWVSCAAGAWNTAGSETKRISQAVV